MTRNLSKPLGRLDERKVPQFCPICGDAMPVMYAPNLTKHLRAKHPEALGRAMPSDGRRGAVAREFAVVSFGKLPALYVVWLDFAYNVQRIDGDDWIIEWAKDGRAVPVNEGEK